MASLGQVVGARVAAIRTTYGLTQEDIAAAARQSGLRWGRSSVAQLEAGVKRLTGEELLVLPHVIATATRYGEELALLELVSPTQGRVELTAEVQPTRSGLEALFAGASGSTRATSLRDMSALFEPLYDFMEIAQRYAGDLTLGSVADAAQSVGEAERKLARKLDVPAVAVAMVAFRLWGRSLSDERDARAGDLGDRRRRQAQRGHITRQLEAELRPLLKDD